MRLADNIKRTVPVDEVKAEWSDLGRLSEIFKHDVVEMVNGVWRWRPNLLVSHLLSGGCTVFQGIPAAYCGGRTPTMRGTLDLNHLWMDFEAGAFTADEMVKFYMDMGYSLSGFSSIFHQREAAHYDLPGAKPAATESEDEEGWEYDGQSIIDYLVERGPLR